jgi:hypothetical protein
VSDIELDVGVQLIASLETLTDALNRQWQHEQKKAQALRQVPLIANQMSLTAGAGVIDDPANLRCPTGYYWSVRRLTLSGFTAGTATVYINSQYGEPVAPFASAGSDSWGKGHILLHPGDRLVVTASGITGYVQLNGAVDLVEARFLYDYLI